jgi:HK97 family phage major capsid protein
MGTSSSPPPRDERELLEAIQELDAQAAGQPFTEAQKQRWNQLNAALDEHRIRRQRLRDLVRRGSTEAEPEDVSKSRPAPVPRHLQAARSDALRAIDTNTNVLTDKAARALEEFVERDVTGPAGGVDSRYIAAVGDPAYARAFGKMLASPQTAHLQMTSDEQAALHTANRAHAERSLAEGTGSTGGFAVPIGLDPTIRLSSDGALNPIRELATVRQMTTAELRLVTSAGVTAAFSAELEDVADGTPELAQPVLYAEKAHAFVPFSIEVGEDWASLQQEMARLIADARDVLESSKFLTGLGHASSEPQGLLVGGTVTITTASTAVYAVADVYNLLQAVPPRFQPNTSWVSSPTMLDKTYRLTPSGSTSEPQLMASRGDGVLGRPTREWSDMATAVNSGSTIVAVGDFAAGFQIGDRVGMTIELIPHLFSTVTFRPRGERGLYAHWRVGAVVAVPQAIRTLVVR